MPELILDLAEDVSYNVQRMAHAVWEAADGPVAEKDVRSALTSNQKTALAAVARRGGRFRASDGGSGSWLQPRPLPPRVHVGPKHRVHPGLIPAAEGVAGVGVHRLALH